VCNFVEVKLYGKKNKGLFIVLNSSRNKAL
jgi:hypothetical protein